ncbi:uncharacterized protein LOC111019395 [Momordica charantia]|uniref:Uncharacterized protein LOC111019395 n=1 Tax=Momordica charantia TaxID=3673 RepID=A0A6J1DER3_MOMCH|nr:uncharacterized protein LOC111019395 [Momordica charantia]
MAISDLSPAAAVLLLLMAVAAAAAVVQASDDNRVFSPCTDTTVKKSDGFTLGLAFATEQKFVFNRTLKLSPCDSRLALTGNSLIAVFRPRVDEISLLTVNTSATSSSFSPSSNGYMVAFAGRKSAARSPPIFVADEQHIVTSFTLVLEFEKGRLQNLFWKRDGCAQCSNNNTFVCINNQACAIRTNNCKNGGGSVDCSLSIQLAFSGTDKHLSVFNSWYEVSKLRQYSLFNLYSNLKDSLTSQYNKIF